MLSKLIDWIKKVRTGSSDMITDEVQVYQPGSITLTEMIPDIRKMLVQWFNYLDQYHAAYPDVRSIRQGILPSGMRYSWGRFAEYNGASFSSGPVEVYVGKDRYLACGYISHIKIRSEGSYIKVWEDGQWLHSVPDGMKKVVYGELSRIYYFNQESRNINFDELIRQQKHARKLKEETEKAKKTAKEQESLMRTYGQDRDVFSTMSIIPTLFALEEVTVNVCSGIIIINGDELLSKCEINFHVTPSQMMREIERDILHELNRLDDTDEHYFTNIQKFVCTLVNDIIKNGEMVRVKA